MTQLFDPLTLRGVTLRNRVGVSPMCQYSAVEGVPGDWHLVHLGSRAVGGAGLVMAEATAVLPEGRISPGCTGIWNEEQARAWSRITAFISQQGAVPGLQIAHAGRKASTAPPWVPGSREKALSDSDGGWEPIAPSAIPFRDGFRVPRAMTLADIMRVRDGFTAAAERASRAGFQWLELHYAHGYLGNSFLSPLANQRTDDYGGSFENRIRFALETAESVRKVWPETLPLAVRLSTVDWVEGGWTLEDSIELAKRLKMVGVDLIDCSSGHIVDGIKYPAAPGWQVPFAESIRSRVGIATAAVGGIADPQLASDIIQSGKADLVLLASKMLHDPYWPLHASQNLHPEDPISLPSPYEFVVNAQRRGK